MSFSPTRETGTQQDNGAPLIGAIVTLAVVAAAVVFVLWRDGGLERGNDRSISAPAAAAALPGPATAVNEGVAPRGGLSEAIADAQAAAVPPRRIIYVVASQDAADRLMSALTDTDAAQAVMGQPSFSYRVVVLPEGTEAGAALVDEQIATPGAGEPPVELVDLRSGSVAPDTP